MIYTAMAAAEAAGELLRRSFGDPVTVNESTAHDIKIQADIDTQALISGLLLERFPDHKLIGEEGDSGNPDGETEWIVDPIDGTVNFALGIPHFCISIAARQKGQVILGVIYDPLRNEMFTTRRGEPMLLNGKKQTVSPRAQLSEAVLAIGFSKSAESVEHCLNLYKHYAHSAKKVRAMGSAALDLAYVACGRLDAYIEQTVSLWDIAAGGLMVESAGGKFDAQLRADGKYKVVASSGRIEYAIH